ncbi:hypothetical protein NE237_018386 [Protea cynaroides]|uniref:Uncharacterized protein n=1 Tax=Protea cynaroides TaxID=273540 RepID=A0A9Q0QNY0_9MAGN|nr:hypothetical protein NE237_018386 [Protea cynaroides]
MDSRLGGEKNSSSLSFMFKGISEEYEEYEALCFLGAGGHVSTSGILHSFALGVQQLSLLYNSSSSLLCSFFRFSSVNVTVGFFTASPFALAVTLQVPSTLSDPSKHLKK